MSVINAQPLSSGFVPSTAGNDTSGISQLPTPVLIQTNDELATVLETGYLTAYNRINANIFSNNQIAFVYTTDQGSTLLKVVVTNQNSVYSLDYIPAVEGTSVTYHGTLTDGDLVKVYDSAGVIEDAGIASDIVATYTGSTVDGNLVQAASTSGEIEDSGIAADTVATYTGSTVDGNIVVAANTTGEIEDGGIAVDALATYTGSTVEGNLVQAANTTGEIEDAGIAADVVATYTGSTVAGNLVKAANTTGEIEDAGFLASKVMQINVVNTMAAGSEIILDKTTGTVSGGAVTISKQSGVITTTSLSTAAGDTVSFTLTNTLIASTSVVLVSLMGGTNTTPGVQLSAVPGSGSATINITNTGGSDFNGTIILGFAVF
jgi:hypothetical protein